MAVISGKGRTMPGAKLPRQQEQAVAALLVGPAIEEAARRVGVSDKTLRNWMANANFSKAYRRAREQIVEKNIAILQAASLSAVECLLRNLRCGKAGCEINAAGKILEHAVGAVEIFDLSQRVSELEERLQGGIHAHNSASANGQAHNGWSR